MGSHEQGLPKAGAKLHLFCKPRTISLIIFSFFLHHQAATAFDSFKKAQSHGRASPKKLVLADDEEQGRTRILNRSCA